MERPQGYRIAAGASWEHEVDAFYELAERVRSLRARALLPFLVLAALAGFAGACAHALGVWPVFGTFEDGSYLVCAPTIVAAALAPGAPVALVGCGLYRALLARTRNAWLEASVTKYGLTREVLEERARIFS